MPIKQFLKQKDKAEQFGPAIRHEFCWAKTIDDCKPGINVRDHCLNVGCVAESLLEQLPIPLRNLLPSGIATLAALHDIGKVSPGFQVKCSKWLSDRSLQDRALKEGWLSLEMDHAKTSQYTVREVIGRSSLGKWAAVVGAHHGKLKGSPSPQPWEEERRRLAGELIAQFGPLPDQSAEDAVLWFVGGLISVADWIGSDEDCFPQNVQWNINERRLRACAALRKIGWQRFSVVPSLSFTDMFPNLASANSLQRATIDTASHCEISIVEGPMGFGKTEAALAAAYQVMAEGQANGLYFGLPTQVTSNRIHERVQPYVSRICPAAEEVRLAHSSSWLVESQPPPSLRATVPQDSEAEQHVQSGRSWFASSKRAILAPFGVGTIDQALLGIVAAKHFFVRQFGLAGKVVILDEIHSYDFYTSTLIELLVKRLRELQCTVIILSATLTGKQRRKLLGLKDGQSISIAYPLVSGIGKQLIECDCEPPRPKTVQIRGISGAAPAGQALNRAAHGECVLWIRNTVEEAQATYREVQSANHEGGPTVALLHSRFPFFRREELESEWINRLGKSSNARPHGCVLISTQVVEQSVDVDADLLITDLAPTDMLLQRLGRLWRHERSNRPSSHPEIWIQMPDLTNATTKSELLQALGKSSRVYAPYVLLRSLQQWMRRDSILLPGDIRTILEATYAERCSQDEPQAWQALRKELEKKKEKMSQQAITATDIWTMPALQDEEGIQTRWNSYQSAQLLLVRRVVRQGAHGVRLDLLNGETVVASDDWDFDVAKALHRNIVRIPNWAITAFLKNPPKWLSEHVQASTAIGVLQIDGCICALDSEVDMGLSYHPAQGIVIHRDRLTRLFQKEFEENEYFD